MLYNHEIHCGHISYRTRCPTNNVKVPRTLVSLRLLFSLSTIFCAWREFELTNKSAEWNVFLEVSNSRRRRTWFTHVRAAKWSNTIQVFYNKNWSCDHLGGFVWRKIYLALWKYDFYDVSLPPIVTRELFVKLVRWEQLWEWSKLAGLPLRSKGGTTPAGNRLKRPRIVLKLRTRRNDNLTLR